MNEVVNRDFVQSDAVARRIELGLPPAPVGEAETALVRAVIKAVLNWAGLDENDAKAPGHQPINVPDMIDAELIGEAVLADIKGRGFRLDAATEHEGEVASFL